MTKAALRISFYALLSLFAAALIVAQSAAPAADQPYAGDRNVTGRAPGATSLTIYDVSSGTKRYLGSGDSIDRDGAFAVAVNPPLELNQKIVVVDSQGRSSSALAVAAKAGPTNGPQ